MTEYYFDHEKLTVYQKSLEFSQFVNELKEQVEPKLNTYGQLERASDSIAQNIAEGNGRLTGRDRCKFFDIARGSALESTSCLDLLLVKKLISIEVNQNGKSILKEIISMLVGLIKSNSNRAYESGENYSGN